MFALKNGNLFFSYTRPSSWSSDAKEAKLYTKEEAQAVLDHWTKMKAQGDKRVEAETKKMKERKARDEDIALIPAGDVFISGVIANHSVMVEL